MSQLLGVLDNEHHALKGPENNV